MPRQGDNAVEAAPPRRHRRVDLPGSSGLAGVLLAVVALAVVGRSFTHRRATDWARRRPASARPHRRPRRDQHPHPAQPRRSRRHLAAHAAPTAKQPHLAAFGASWQCEQRARLRGVPRRGSVPADTGQWRSSPGAPTPAGSAGHRGQRNPPHRPRHQPTGTTHRRADEPHDGAVDSAHSAAAGRRFASSSNPTSEGP